MRKQYFSFIFLYIFSSLLENEQVRAINQIIIQSCTAHRDITIKQGENPDA